MYCGFLRPLTPVNQPQGKVYWEGSQRGCVIVCIWGRDGDRDKFAEPPALQSTPPALIRNMSLQRRKLQKESSNLAGREA